MARAPQDGGKPEYLRKAEPEEARLQKKVARAEAALQAGKITQEDFYRELLALQQQQVVVVSAMRIRWETFDSPDAIADGAEPRTRKGTPGVPGSLSDIQVRQKTIRGRTTNKSEQEEDVMDEVRKSIVSRLPRPCKHCVPVAPQREKVKTRVEALRKRAGQVSPRRTEMEGRPRERSAEETGEFNGEGSDTPEEYAEAAKWDNRNTGEAAGERPKVGGQREELAGQFGTSGSDHECLDRHVRQCSRKRQMARLCKRSVAEVFLDP